MIAAYSFRLNYHSHAARDTPYCTYTLHSLTRLTCYALGMATTRTVHPVGLAFSQVIKLAAE